ncbi:MAG: C4-type zinc ribbon domain-containing protein [Pyrinomonadaceae bacterium]
MKAELEKLIALQQTDTTIRKLLADIEAIPQRRAEIEQEFDQRAFEIRALENTRDTAKAERAQLEADLAEAKTNAERADRNLMASTNEHEYTSALREADSNRKLASTLEASILEKMEVLETAETQLGEREPEVAKLRKELKAKLAEFDSRVKSETAEITEKRTEREKVIAALPKNLAHAYNRLITRSKDGLAVAEAKNSACTACSIALRPQMMSEVRAGKEIMICDNCGRILYYAHPVALDAPETPETAEAQTAAPNAAA